MRRILEEGRMRRNTKEALTPRPNAEPQSHSSGSLAVSGEAMRQGYHSQRKVENLVMETLREEFEQALYWANRIKRGEDLALTDLCISTLQRNVEILLQHISPHLSDHQPQTYRGICPGCGRTVELERQ
jgi:hypothetical protein